MVRRLKPLCEPYGITKLDIFGSVARGEAEVGSGVDLVARVRKIPGRDFFLIADTRERRLGVPVDLLIFEDLEEMENPCRKDSIERDRRTIHGD
jgi:predicted nucleotidyltransferase